MSTLNYRVRPSTLEKNAPVLFMLHGYGSDENDLFSFASELPEELLIISLQAPYKMQPFGHAWYTIHFEAPQGKWNDNEQAIQSRDLVAELIDELQEKYHFDKNNVTLLGFSQGTILSIAIALTYPEKVKNVIGLSGYVNKDIIDLKSNLAEYKHLAFYCSHGTVDQVIPVEWSRQTKPFLDSLQISNTYNEFPVGHGVAPQNFYEFKNWLVDRLNG